MQTGNQQQQTPPGVLFVSTKETPTIYLNFAGCLCLDWRLPPPSLVWHAFVHLVGKADPFRVAVPYPKPPSLFHDKPRARWRMPTGGDGESANPRVQGCLGSGVHWGTPARGSGWVLMPRVLCSGSQSGLSRWSFLWDSRAHLRVIGDGRNGLPRWNLDHEQVPPTPRGTVQLGPRGAGTSWRVRGLNAPA